MVQGSGEVLGGPGESGKAWKDEAREQREKVKEVEKEVKRLRERVAELERRGKE